MPVRIKAHTSDREGQVYDLTVNAGPTLLEILQNAEVPIKSSCLGKGLCRQCRVRVESGFAPVTASDAKSFSKALLDQGWRLSCSIRPRVPLTVFFPQSYTFSEKISIARAPVSDFDWICDYGTTGVEIAGMDRDGMFATIHGLNKQVLHGSDIMTRLEYSQRNGTEELRAIGRAQIELLVAKLKAAIAEKAPFVPTGRMVLAGNSAVTSFLAGLDVSELGVSPYAPATLEPQDFIWDTLRIETLRLLHSFVGGDLFAGLYALWLEKDSLAKPWILMDVGTNSEILYWDTEFLYVSSTPAGPAFEGSSISIGMRAENGAIVDPRYADGKWSYTVIGGDLPKGICGSALIQAVDESVKSGAVAADGEVLRPEALAFTEKLNLSQDDYREFQLAKSAIRTGLELIVESGKCAPETLYLGGAFGEHLPLAEAQSIGLLPRIPTRALGNTSLAGTALWARANDADRARFSAWLDDVKRPIELALSDRFQELFVKNMTLGETAV